MLEGIGALLIILSVFIAEKAAERYKVWCWSFFVVLVVAQAGLALHSRWTDEREKADQQGVISGLRKEVGELTTQLAAQSKSIEEIKGSAIVSGKAPIKVEVTNPARPLLAPGQDPAILANVRIASQRRVASTEPEYPFALEVVIQTSETISPVAFAVECDGEIGKGNAAPSGSSMMTNIRMGLAQGHNNVFIFQWETPAFIPDVPITVTLQSKTAIRATKLHKLQFRR